jgi:hypothetical protein
MIFVVSGMNSRKTPADLRVGTGVHGAGGIVQNQDLRLFEQRPRDAQPLLLPAGHIAPPCSIQVS